MLQTSVFEYYAFGFNFSLLKAETEGSTVATMKHLLGLFLPQLEQLDLAVTSKIADELRLIEKKISTQKETTVNAATMTEIAEQLARIDPALDAELQMKKAYVLTKKRYPLETLTSSCTELLSDKGKASLSDNSRRDFELACMQIALAQPTASAFHLMRALEEQVRILYFNFKKTHRLEKPMWGPMTQQLAAKKSPKPSAKLLSHLDGMRIHFRNPTQHPDAFYTADEAQDLLNQTIVAINMIAGELR